jgi:hypothetical protein
MKYTFRKVLSSNDVGITKSHQAGMLIPKANSEFINFLGSLDSTIKNPRKKIACVDDCGEIYELNFIYYNNKFHDSLGTRNEYRLTGLSAFFKKCFAQPGDEVEISKNSTDVLYSIRIISKISQKEVSNTVVLRGWTRIH